MATALLWVFVLGFTQVFYASCKAAGEISPMKVDLLAEEQRIIGGKKATVGQIPFVVSLHFDDEFICTGSIISRTKMVTAAHCVTLDGERQDPNRYFGTYGTTKRSSLTRRTNINKIAIHPSYSEGTLDGDIAILWTDPMQFDALAEQICLSKVFLPEGKICTAAGWGLTIPSAPGFSLIGAPEDLRYADLKTSSPTLCNVTYLGSITERHLCAKSPSIFPRGICNGDSGGPFYCPDPEKGVVLSGISSFGSAIFGCGTPLLSGTSVFTRVSTYVNWITMTANDSEICIVG